MRGAVALLGCALASALLTACSREDEKPKMVDLTPGFARVVTVLPEGGAPAAAPSGTTARLGIATILTSPRSSSTSAAATERGLRTSRKC